MAAIIPYVLLAIALLGGYGAYQANKADAAIRKLDAVVNQLDALQQGVEASNAVLINMNGKLVAGTGKATIIRERVIQMEKNDATVRTFLDTPTPGDGCMLDDTCGATTGAKRSAVVPMLAASATGK